MRYNQKHGRSLQYIIDAYGTIWFRRRLYVPKKKDLINVILSEAHNVADHNHHGSTKMYRDLKKRFWWSI